MKKLLLLLAIPVALSLTGCKKEGCTDMFATNYSDAAKKDDGSCTYTSKLIFWQDIDAATSWVPLNVSSLKFYVNGQYIGSCMANDYMTGQPSCSQNGQTATTIELGKNKTATVQIKVTDQTDFIWYEETVPVTAGDCNYYQVY
jgi:outer membrane lipoprotein SlyB